jgi:hypothetical protein
MTPASALSLGKGDAVISQRREGGNTRVEEREREVKANERLKG